MIRAESLPGGSELHCVTMLQINHEGGEQGTENDVKKTMAATNPESTSVSSISHNPTALLKVTSVISKEA